MKEDTKDKIEVISMIIGVIIAVVVITIGVRKAANQPDPQPVTYEVLKKDKSIDSHWNWFTDKQVIDTKYLMLLKNTETKNVFTTNVDENTYFRFDVGQRFTRSTSYINDR